MDFHITRVEQVYMDNLANWYKADLKQNYLEELKNRQQADFAKIVRTPDKDPDPTGPGWVIELRGYHYYNGTEKKGYEGAAHVSNYLIEFLENGMVQLPGDKPGTKREVSLYDLGIRRPILRNKDDRPNYAYRVPNPDYMKILEERGIKPSTGLGSGGKPSFGGAGGAGKPSFGGGTSGAGTMSEEGSSGGSASTGSGALGSSGTGSSINPGEPIKDALGNVVPPDFEAPKFEFVVQFAWKPGDLATAIGPAVVAPVAAPASNETAGSNDEN
jgi:type IV pilus assembly protein PilM